MTRPSPHTLEILARLDAVRDILVLLDEVGAILARDPTATANEVAAVLRLQGKGRRQGTVRAAVSALRSREPWRGRGRPQRGADRFSERVERLLGDAE